MVASLTSRVNLLVVLLNLIDHGSQDAANVCRRTVHLSHQPIKRSKTEIPITIVLTDQLLFFKDIRHY